MDPRTKPNDEPEQNYSDDSTDRIDADEPPTDSRRVVHGVDFSGARQAGGKIRIATGVLEEGLRIERCRSVAETIGTPQRGPALEYLREFLASASGRAVVGLDFSFGVPHRVTDAEDWQAFVRDFDFESVDEMTDTYVRRTNEQTNGQRTYLKRATDEETGASSPYGFVVASQTLFGIRDVLRPLARDGRVSVLPMDDSGKNEPWLCEVYPAATLRDLGLPDETYKNDGKYPDARSRRERIVSGLREAGLSFAEEEIVETAIEDSGGDALDSIVAAVGIARALRENRLTAASGSFDDRRRLEGHIYV